MYYTNWLVLYFGTLKSTNIAKLESEISQKMWDQGDPLSPNEPKTNGTLGRRKSRRAPQPPSSIPKVHQLERMVDQLAIRNPSELVIGIAKSVATQWRHTPRHLVGPGVCYHAQVSIIINLYIEYFL